MIQYKFSFIYKLYKGGFILIFRGSSVALITPFNDDGSVNYEKLGELIEFHIENSTDAIVACGTTGEASTLDDKEHL